MSSDYMTDCLEMYRGDLKATAVRRVFLHNSIPPANMLGFAVPLHSIECFCSIVSAHFTRIDAKMVAAAEATGGNTEAPNKLTYSEMCQWILDTFEVDKLAKSLFNSSASSFISARCEVIDNIKAIITQDDGSSYVHHDIVSRISFGISSYLVTTCSSSEYTTLGNGGPRCIEYFSPDAYSTRIVTFIMNCLTNCDTAVTQYTADATPLVGLARAVAINQVLGHSLTSVQAFPSMIPLHTPIHESYAQTLESMIRRNILAPTFEKNILCSVYPRECADMLLAIVHSGRMHQESSGPVTTSATAFIKTQVVNGTCVKSMRKLLIKNPELIDLLPFSME